MKFSLVCRTCLASDTLQPIFTDKNDYKMHSNRIYIATGIKVRYKDKLPQNMCRICVSKINETHKFRQQCEEVKTKLLKIIEKENRTNSEKNKTEFINKTVSSNRTKLTKEIVIKNNNNKDKKCNKSGYDDIKIETNPNDAKLHSKIDDKSKNDDLSLNYENTENIYVRKPELTTVLIINRIDDDGIKIDNDSDNDMNIGVHSNDIDIGADSNNRNIVVDSNDGKNLGTFSNKIGVSSNNLNIDTDSDDDKPLKSLFEYKSGKAKAVIKNCYLNNENTNYNNKIDGKKYKLKTELKIKGIKKLSKRKNNNLKTFSKSDSPDLPYDFINDPNNGKVTKVFCKICCKELSIRSIASHMSKRHPGADSRKVQCELCETYLMADKLNRHNIMMHTGNGCYVCRYCKVTFEIKEKLIEHVKICTSKKRKRNIYNSSKELLQCDICHKVMQKASLRMHNAMKHAGLKPVCQYCGISFGNKLRLQEHYRAKHGYEKFKCKYCEFTSAAVMAMRNHERRHVGEKPYVCESCGVKFHAAYLLTQHKQSHRTDKNVKCDLCPAAFKANNSLHMHKLTCHSNATYMCTLCCRSYKCRHYATKHIRHVHRYNGKSLPITVVNKQDVVTMTKD